ncbi:YvcK family protein [Candidatus Uhrbacteria bacterium]|nr:YvcK family protein [Candidatus Uhrbacteria bacterium]
MTKRIVVIGGGTGTYTVLTGLKRQKGVHLSAVVTMSDDGGHTGELRDDLGVLPPGDLRQCLVALSDDQDDTWRKLFSHRFPDGSGKMTGQSVGNIILSALEGIYGDPLSAIQTAHRLLRVRGQVIPVSLNATTLCAELEDRTVIRGEHHIEERREAAPRIRRCYLEPDPKVNAEAVAEIENADAIVVGPGDYWTSIVPNLIVPGIPQALAALQNAGGRIYFVCNLVTKRGQTDGYAASDFKRRVEELIAPATVDVMLINTLTPNPLILERYGQGGETLIQDDLPRRDPRVLRKPLISSEISEAASGDRLRRSLLRHDSERLAHAIGLLLQESQ